MVRNLVLDGLGDAYGGARALIVLNLWFACSFRGLDDLEGGKSLNTSLTTEAFIGFLVAIDSSYLCKAEQCLGCLFVGGLEIPTVSTPRRVESR